MVSTTSVAQSVAGWASTGTSSYRQSGSGSTARAEDSGVATSVASAEDGGTDGMSASTVGVGPVAAGPVASGPVGTGLVAGGPVAGVVSPDAQPATISAATSASP